MKRMNEIEEILIEYLKSLNNIESDINLENRLAIRALMNISDPTELSDEYYKYQDEYLQTLLKDENVVDSKKISILNNKMCIYDGDITLIKADAIVNCANHTLCGCKTPLHSCLDNRVHAFSGLQLRRDCLKISSKKEIKSGSCYPTKGYNLPCKYVFHVVLDNLEDEITDSNKETLKNCYLSALNEADNYNCKYIVFPQMEFDGDNYPVSVEAEIAYKTVKEYLDNNKDSEIEKVIFCVNNSYAYSIYEKVLLNKGMLNKYKLNKKFF